MRSRLISPRLLLLWPDRTTAMSHFNSHYHQKLLANKIQGWSLNIDIYEHYLAGQNTFTFTANKTKQCNPKLYFKLTKGSDFTLGQYATKVQMHILRHLNLKFVLLDNSKLTCRILPCWLWLHQFVLLQKASDCCCKFAAGNESVELWLRQAAADNETYVLVSVCRLISVDQATLGESKILTFKS